MSRHEKSSPTLNQTTYDVLKQSAQLILPALGALYFALAEIWGFPRAEEVVGSIAALNAFVGVVVGLAARQYNHSEAKFDGDINVVEDDGRKVFTLELNAGPEELESKDQVIFKVNS